MPKVRPSVQKGNSMNFPSYVQSAVRRDMEMWELLAVATKDAVCEKLGVSMNTLDGRLNRARKRRKESHWHINHLNNLMKRNPRLRKIMLSGNEKDEDLIDDLTEIE